MTTPPQRSADEWAAAVARGGLDPQSLTLAGYALAQAQRVPEAVQALLQALALKPDFVPAHTGLAGCLAQEGLHREAAEAFRTAHLLDPRRVGDLAHALFQLRSACAWEGLEAEMALLRQEIGRSDATHRVDPFAAMALGLSPADQRRAAERWAAEVRAKAGAALPPLRWQWDGQRPLRVGYLGADFYSHATLWLCIGLLEAHDRQRFDITLYDHGRSDRSDLRLRAEAAARIVPLHALDDRAAAQRLRADGIDILIDLKGYTRHARPGIVALRPAPLQLGYLGHPGTLGGKALDGLIGDAVLTPADEARYYSETLLRLPDSYQPFDDRRPPLAADARAAHGLPDDALVLAAFHQPYKLSAEVWALWLRLAQAEPRAVLWLLSGNPQSDACLRARWQAAGLAPGRLVLAPKLPLLAHLQRLACADLALDTFPVNGHTTSSDALHAGVPLLSFAGEGLAARVSASLLHAAGLADAVCADLDELEQRLLHLMRDAAARRQWRERLHAARQQAPLFDTRRHARAFEDLLLRAAAQVRRRGRLQPLDALPGEQPRAH
jgi:protein O-GlcNAc transferase